VPLARLIMALYSSCNRVEGNVEATVSYFLCT
jgi:hypothetical protein